MGSRRKGRERALQILFQVDFLETEPHEVMSSYWETQSAAPEVREFACRIVEGVWRNRVEIDELIQKHSTNWRLERMSAIDRNILRIATYELIFERDIAPSVTLNEAIEVAKRFGTEESGAFINGLLDPIAKTVQSRD